MHREPRPRDIVRVPGSAGPEIVITCSGSSLVLAPLLGEDFHVVTCDWRRVRLVGVASPRSHGRRSQATRAPETAPVAAPTSSPPPEATVLETVRYGSGAVDIADLY